MHKRIRPCERIFSVCDSTSGCRLSLVGTFELANHFRIRYNILSNPRCQCAIQLLGCYAGAKIRKKKDNNAVLREKLLILFNPLVNTSYRMMGKPLFDASLTKVSHLLEFPLSAEFSKGGALRKPLSMGI